jgi:hypothetical protein
MNIEKLEVLKSYLSSLIKAQKDSLKCAKKRAELDGNSTRANITSLNASWARKDEYRDKCILNVQKLYEDIF